MKSFLKRSRKDLKIEEEEEEGTPFYFFLRRGD
jgi:hypothetical protein